jgi:transposase
MPRPHPPEFRQRAVELARSGEKPVSQIAKDLGISDSCLRGWLRQADVDDGTQAVSGSHQKSRCVSVRSRG